MCLAAALVEDSVKCRCHDDADCCTEVFGSERNCNIGGAAGIKLKQAAPGATERILSSTFCELCVHGDWVWLSFFAAG